MCRLYGMLNMISKSSAYHRPCRSNAKYTKVEHAHHSEQSCHKGITLFLTECQDFNDHGNINSTSPESPWNLNLHIYLYKLEQVKIEK